MRGRLVIPVLAGILILGILGFSQQANATGFPHTHTENHTHHDNHVHTSNHNHTSDHCHFNFLGGCLDVHIHDNNHVHTSNHDHTSTHVHATTHTHFISIFQQDITVPATSAFGATVFFTPAVQNPEPSGNAICGPSSGGTFSIGSTTVTCTLSDRSGNTESITFTVTVLAVDGDGDGVPDFSDQCPGEDDTIDVDNDGIPDCIDPNVDSDRDGVPDVVDQCPGEDDRIDVDNDGIPDCTDTQIDSDGDGVADSLDQCPGFDDTVDVDSDGIPDGCDSFDGTTCGLNTIADDALEQCVGISTGFDCGLGTIPDTTLGQCVADTTALDTALAELDNLYINNSCAPLADSIPNVLICISDLNADLVMAQSDLDAANDETSAKMTTIAGIQAELDTANGLIMILEEALENIQEDSPVLGGVIAQIQAQIDEVDMLVNDDDLKKKEGKKLTKKLGKVIKDTMKKSCKDMDKFIKEVNKLNEKEKLDPAKADALITAAQNIKTQFGCT